MDKTPSRALDLASICPGSTRSSCVKMTSSISFFFFICPDISPTSFISRLGLFDLPSSPRAMAEWMGRDAEKVDVDVLVEDQVEE